MTQSVFIILCIFIVTIRSAEIKCGVNELLDYCPADCETNYCPTRENYERSCKKPIRCPAPACKCIFNFSRAQNGTCIPTRYCPAFPCSHPYEKFVSCPPYCPTDNCSQATPDGICPLFGNILVVVQCRPACRCKEGYWRKEGVCGPYDQCPTKDKEQESLELLSNIFNL